MLRDLLSEKSGISMMRLLSLLAVLTSMAIACFGMLQHYALSEVSLLSGVFLSAGFGAKLGQKLME